MNEKIPTADLLRIAYQQKAATYLFSVAHQSTINSPKSSISWVGEAARSLALRTIYNKPNLSISIHESTQKNSDDSKWSEFVCFTCGTLSHPQNPTSSTTILKSMKRGSTRRRRSSRSKARQCQRDLLLKQHLQSVSNNPQLKQEIKEKGTQRKMAYSYIIGDGRSRQCIVNKCGHCGGLKKRKGVNVKPGGRTKRAKKIPSLQKSPPASRSQKDEFQGGNDFISLPCNLKESGNMATNKMTAAPKSGFSFKKKQACNDNSMQLLSGGKKKKVKKKQPGSKLMDFLSSLND